MLGTILFPLPSCVQSVLGTILFLVLVYELISGRAYGLRKGLIGKETRTRWHRRADDPLTYWKLVANRALISAVLIGITI